MNGTRKVIEKIFAMGEVVSYCNLFGRVSGVMRCSDGRRFYRIGCFPQYIEGKKLSKTGFVDMIGIKEGE